jgi:uncharacterized protein (TIGR00297 family)
VNSGLAAVGLVARAITPGGAIAGVVIGTTIALGAGLSAWILLVAMFALVAGMTRASARRRRGSGRPGQAERRGAGNALANTGLAAIGAALLLSTGWWAARVGLTAALIASGSDSIASEAGQGWGRRTWHLRRGRVASGTTGGMSLIGTLAGVSSVGALTAFAALVGLVTWREAIGVGFGALLAFLIEGAIISQLEDAGWLNNDETNLLGTVVAAVLATTWVHVFG